MLSFGPPPTASNGQPFKAPEMIFADHLDRTAVYGLPTNLEILPAADGDPDFFLLRYHGDSATAKGGLLRFALGFGSLPEALSKAVQAAGLTLHAVNFSAARFRLRLRSLAETASHETGQWHRAVIGRELAAPMVSLTPRESQFLETLLETPTNVVEVEVDLRYSGLIPGLPWMATIDTAALQRFLSTLLPAEKVTAEQVTAAFLSLPEQGACPVTFQRLDPTAVKPPFVDLLKELALRSIERIFELEGASDEFTASHYRLRAPTPGAAPILSFDLLTARQETRALSLTWSVTSLIESLDTPEKRRQRFPIVSQVSPFALVEIHVINRVPYDPHFLRKTVVDLRYRGASGVAEYRSFTFDGTTDLQSFSLFHMAMTGDLELAVRFTTTLAPPSGSGWPVIRKSPFTAVAGTVVEINRAALGMDFVRLEADRQVFDKAAAVEVAIYPSDPGPRLSPEAAGQPMARFSLTADCPAAWMALADIEPAADLYASAAARSLLDPQAPPYVLRLDRLVDRRVRIAGYQLEVLDPVRITIELDPEASGRLAMIQATLASSSGAEKTLTLSPGQPAAWSFFPDSVFSPPSYRYRLDYVAMDATGQTLPMASEDWTEARTPHLVVRPSLITVEAGP